MTPEQVVRVLEEVGAIRKGHFELSSGRHSDTYVQCALVLQHPKYATQLGAALAEKFHDMKPQAVVSPAIGGLIIGQEVGKALDVRAFFVERDKSGQMALRRGFEVKRGEQILVVEDVWTTGGSTRETIGVLEEFGGVVIAAGAIIDRSAGRAEWNIPARALVEMTAESFEAVDCPQCRRGGAAVKPGSRFSRGA